MEIKNIQSSFIIKKAYLLNKEKNGSFEMLPSIHKQIVTLDNDAFEVSIKVEIKDTDEHPFPIDLEVEGSIKTKFLECVPDKNELDDFLNITCVNALYPYIRSTISNLCTASLMNPIVLPFLDVRQLKEKKW